MSDDGRDEVESTLNDALRLVDEVRIEHASLLPNWLWERYKSTLTAVANDLTMLIEAMVYDGE